MFSKDSIRVSRIKGTNLVQEEVHVVVHNAKKTQLVHILHMNKV
jgi:hypothetical protein